MEVPRIAEANGHCEDQQTEINLRWRDQDGEGKYLLNLVVTKKDRLASLGLL